MRIEKFLMSVGISLSAAGLGLLISGIAIIHTSIAAALGLGFAGVFTLTAGITTIYFAEEG